MSALLLFLPPDAAPGWGSCFSATAAAGLKLRTSTTGLPASANSTLTSSNPSRSACLPSAKEEEDVRVSRMPTTEGPHLLLALGRTVGTTEDGCSPPLRVDVPPAEARQAGSCDAEPALLPLSWCLNSKSVGAVAASWESTIRGAQRDARGSLMFCCSQERGGAAGGLQRYSRHTSVIEIESDVHL